MFLAIAAAVAIFIINGNRWSAREESFEEIPIHLDSETRERISREYAKIKILCPVMIAFGVVLIILGAGAFTVIEVPIPLFLNIIGFSVFLFIISGTYSSAYDILLGKGDYAHKVTSKAAERIIGTIAAVYWPVVTAVYLFGSFISGAWHISWVIWPVAGVLFGAIAGGVSVWYTTKEKD
jgi:hypothetical protein